MDIFPITITSRALEEVKGIVNSKKIPEGYGLRVGIKGSACSAATIIGFDKPQEFDKVFDHEGVEVVIDKRHIMYLLGTIVDFEDREDGRGFVFKKENDK